MRSTAPPSRKAGHVGSLSGHAARITDLRTLSWSSGAARPPGGTSRFPQSLQRSTASKGRFLDLPEVPWLAQHNHPYTSPTWGRVSSPRGSGTAPQSRSHGRPPSAPAPAPLAAPVPAAAMPRPAPPPPRPSAPAPPSARGGLAGAWVVGVGGGRARWRQGRCCRGGGGGGGGGGGCGAPASVGCRGGCTSPAARRLRGRPPLRSPPFVPPVPPPCRGEQGTPFPRAGSALWMRLNSAPFLAQGH